MLRRLSLVFCISFAVLGLLSTIVQVAAHEVRPAIATLTLPGDETFVLAVETNLEAVIAGIGAEHEDTEDAPEAREYNALRQLEPASLEARFNEIAERWIADIGLTVDGQSLRPVLQTVEIPTVGDTDLARDTTIRLVGDWPANASRVEWSRPERYGASVLRIEQPDAEMIAQFVAAGSGSGPISLSEGDTRPWWRIAWDYIVSGFEHILPLGLDHILFVLGLFFLALRWRPLLWQVSAFTLAHTVTLALGLYGVINISPSIVEPLIALSIVYVAVENILTRELHAWRPAIVFAFGLLHGLGFAGVLQEFGLPPDHVPLALISFNIGVELGQLTVLLLAFIAVGWAANKPWYRSRIAIPASVAIALMGAYWFLERTVLA